jgi:hypothetical protein
MTYVVKHLPRKHRALNSDPSTTKKKTKKKTQQYAKAKVSEEPVLLEVLEGSISLSLSTSTESVPCVLGSRRTMEESMSPSDHKTTKQRLLREGVRKMSVRSLFMLYE